MLRAIIALLILATPVAGQDMVTDAFGVLPADQMSEARATWSGLRTTGRETVSVPPQSPSTLLLFLGPKSIVAGKEDGHAVAIALDQFGNLVANGLGAKFELGPQTHVAQTLDGIADKLFRPAPRAETLPAGVTIAGRQSPRAIFRVTADLESATPTIESFPRDAAPETFTEFQTGPLVDKFGNVVADGVASSIIVTHDDGRWTYLIPTAVDGRAGVTFLPRDVSANGNAIATIASKSSPPQPIRLRELGSVEPTRTHIWAIPEINAVQLRAGPFVTNLGYLLVDGARVTVILTGKSAANSRSGWTRDGYFEATFAVSPTDGPYEVEITSPLGVEQATVELSGPPISNSLRGAE